MYHILLRYKHHSPEGPQGPYSELGLVHLLFQAQCSRKKVDGNSN